MDARICHSWDSRNILKFFRISPFLVLVFLFPISTGAGLLLQTGSASWASPSQSATISLISISQGYFTSGQRVTAAFTVKNTGPVAWDFHVGLSFQDADLKWWNGSYTQIVLDAGAQSPISYLSWRIDPATPAGPMAAKVTVWAGESEGQPITELASHVQANAFSIYPANANRPTSVTATWVDPGATYPASTPATISTLLQHGVNAVFLNAGCIDSRGNWNPPNQLNYHQFVSEAKLAGLSVIAWINHGESCGGVSGRMSSQDISSPLTRTNVANVVSTLTSPAYGFEGVQFDIEPVAWDSMFMGGYLGLLEAVRPRNYSGHFQVYVPIGSLRYAKDAYFLSGFLSKLNQVGVTEVVDSLYNSGRKTVSDYQSLVVSDVQWMTANSPVKVIFGLPAYEDQTASHDPSVENIGNALVGIWMALSSSSVNWTQFRGVAVFSYRELDSSKWAILDQLWTNHSMETISTTSVPAQNTSTNATVTSSVAEVQPTCVIATAAYGSELAPPVQFLRNFRDGQIKQTYLGNRFMSGFNAWYYSWAPAVAQQETGNGWLRAALRVVILPLLASMIVSQAAFQGVVAVNPELAVVAAGFIASSLIGLAYLTPLTYLVHRLAKRNLTRRTILWGAMFAAAMALIGTIPHSSTGIDQILTAVFVVESIVLTPLTLVTSITKLLPKPDT